MENQNRENSGVNASKSNYKVKLMCSYGGEIRPSTRDHHLSYVGGDTKILAVYRRVKFSDVVTKLTSLCDAPDYSLIKYQLPGEDLDALVSVIDDSDLEHMMAEYDLVNTASSKPARIRLFLFYPKSAPAPVTNPDFLFGFDKGYEYDYVTHSPPPKPNILPGQGATGPDTPGSDSGIKFSRESHVTRNQGDVVQTNVIQ